MVRRLLTESHALRFPMYVRNVKQVLRQANGSFDERAYGFAGLMDLLRACQRDGVLRLERDRRGALRVFPGSQISAPVGGTGRPAVVERAVERLIASGGDPAPSDVQESPAFQGFQDVAAGDEDESTAHIKDTTAEMLARAAAGETPARRRKPVGAAPKGRRPVPRTQGARNGRPRPRKTSSDQS